VVSDAIGAAFRALLKKLDINGHRAFYAIRHGFQTVAEEAGDLAAVKHIMGHIDSSMSGTYRERISDVRLKVVTDHVHQWLWLPKVDGDTKTGTDGRGE
jgi:integrase